mmetsp:Transcript_2586/g.4907  ORF Transcript_2586/g.4907 Transcript_2586/m.4907 type:complete len:200 (-) Transcript_2586:626-1225(-)
MTCTKSRGLVLLCLVALPLFFAALVAGFSLAARARLKTTAAGPRTKAAYPMRPRSMYLPSTKPKAAVLSSFAPDPLGMFAKPMAKIQFKNGLDERSIPTVRLTRSPDAKKGVAIFRFEKPDLYNHVDLEAEVDGMMLIDEEGSLSTQSVFAHFSEVGVPKYIEAKYVMESTEDWERFMRFMEKYAQTHGLEFQPSRLSR